MGKRRIAADTLNQVQGQCAGRKRVGVLQKTQGMDIAP
jgi:hypothetical protein